MCRQSAMRVMRVALRAMRVALRALAILAVAISIPCARADSLAGASASPALCASTPPMTAAQQDRLLRFAQVVRRELGAIARLLAGAFHVRGLASLDVLLEGERIVRRSVTLGATGGIYGRRWRFQAKGKRRVKRSLSRPPTVQPTSAVVTLSMKSVRGRAST